MKSKFILLLLTIFSLNAIASIVTKGEKKPGSAEEIVPGKILVRTIKLREYLDTLDPKEVVEKRDSLGGANPDIFIIYKVEDNGRKQLVMQLFDLNRNGKINLVKHFEKGKLVKEEKATPEGVTNLVVEYDAATGNVKKKSQADTHTNIWTYFIKNEIYRKEVDRNFDGKPDMWVYYRKGKIYRTEIDKNFDGKKIVKIDGPYNPSEEKSVN